MLFDAQGRLINRDDLPQEPEVIEIQNENQVVMVPKELLETQTGREVAKQQVLDRRMQLARDACAAYEAMLKGEGGVTLGDSDEYGDRPILHKGKDTGHVVGAGLAKDRFNHITDYTPDKTDEDL